MTTPKVPTAPALVTRPNVDIMATGQWDLSTGEVTFTTEDLANAVAASGCTGVGCPIIKLGHIDPRFDGEPAVGRVENMALAASGNKLVGDLAGMPAWLGEVIESAYPNRSVEGCWDFVCSIGHTHPFVITGLALLGVASPGIGVLSSLADVGTLYGVAASKPQHAGRPWVVRAGRPVEQGAQMSPVIMAAGVTTEDVRSQYYLNPDVAFTMWVTEIQLAPPQLIVADEATNKVYRVPITIKGSDVTFGEPQEVVVEYVDVPASKAAATRAAVAFASRDESRAGVVTAAWDGPAQVKNLGSDPTQAQLDKLFALPAGTKTDSKLPHHNVASDGTVGDANDDGCSAGIGAINGAMGGLVDVSEADKKKAYDHLAAHLAADGKEPAEYAGSAADPDKADDPVDPEASADDPKDKPAAPGSGPVHGAFNGSHSHPHSAMGSQAGDETHDHAHSHTGDASHAHAHGASATRNGVDMDFTDAQLAAFRTRLGLAEDAELTAEQIMAALDAPAGPSGGTGTGRLPDGAIVIDAQVWEDTQAQLAEGVAARRAQLTGERDNAIQDAIAAGKFPASRRKHWEAVYDSNPEGTKEIMASLRPGTVPMDDIGSTGGDAEFDQEYAALFPPGYRSGAAQKD